MNKYYSIPRYLGLSHVNKYKNKKVFSFGFAHQNKLKVTLDTKGEKLISYLLKPRTKKQISKNFKMSDKKTDTKLKILLKNGLVKEDFKKNIPSNLKRYDRHMLFYQMNDLDPIIAQKTLSKKTITLIGCGGIGNWTSLNLIGFGFKQINLLDFDTIEESNLTRQVLFNESNIGQLKGKVAQNVLQKKNSQTKVKFIKIKVTDVKTLQKALKGSDFVIHSADRPAQIHDWINKACINLKVPYLNVGYMDGVGVVGPLTVPTKTSCYSCFKTKNTADKINKKEDLFNYQAPSFGPLNAMAATLGAMEVVKYFLLPNLLQSYDCMLNIDPMTFEISKTCYSKDINCHDCKSSSH